MYRFVICVAIAAGSACSNSELDKLQQVKDKVCACKDPACAEAALADVPSDGERSPKARELARSIHDCMGKLYEKGRPVTDPDAEPSTDPGSAAPASAKTP